MKMAHYLDKIEQLSAAAGFPSNSMERIQLSTLENEMEIIISMIQAKRQALEGFDGILEKKKLELQAEKDYEDRFSTEVKEDITRLKQKNMILMQYLSSLDSEDFPLFKLSLNLDRMQTEFFAICSTVMDKAKSVNEEFKKIQELQEKCDQLRLQTIN